MRDEGVGVQAVRTLEEGYELPPELKVVDGGTAGLDLLPYIEGRRRVLFVDAVNFGKEPGFIGMLENEAILVFFSPKASLHHLGLADLLAAAQLLEVSPKEVCLIGIQPDILEPGLELSEILQRKMKSLLTQILWKLQDWGITCRPLSS